MIELTEQQVLALEDPQATPARVLNPRTREECVLLPFNAYQRLKAAGYDDSPWTREDLQSLARGAGEREGWEDASEDAADKDRPPRDP